MHVQGNASSGSTNGDGAATRLPHMSGTSASDAPVSNDTVKGNGDIVANTDNDATVIEHASGVIDARGGMLSCPETGVSLIIPEGAIDEGVGFIASVCHIIVLVYLILLLKILFPFLNYQFLEFVAFF